jgi:ABC-type proline/glycine betaine transport system ATPase subunit
VGEEVNGEQESRMEPPGQQDDEQVDREEEAADRWDQVELLGHKTHGIQKLRGGMKSEVIKY